MALCAALLPGAILFDSEATCQQGSISQSDISSCSAEENGSTAQAEVLTEVDYGNLGVFAFAQVEGTGGTSAADATIGFFESLTINSPTLNGTSGFIELIATVGLLNDGPLTDAIELNGVAYSITEDDTVISVLAPFTFGDEISFSVMLALRAEAGCVGCPTDDLRLASFQTDLFRVRDASGRLLGGYNVETISGTEYEFEAVPEPTSWALMTAGGAMLMGVARVRRRRP